MKPLKYLLFIALGPMACLHAQDSRVADSLLQALPTLGRNAQRVDAWNELAFQFRNADAARAQYFASAALALADSIGYANGVSDSNSRLGVLAKNAGDYPHAEQYYLQALSARKALGDSARIAQACNNLGNLYKLMGQYEKACRYYAEGLDWLAGPQPTDEKAKLHNALGTAHFRLGQYEEATRQLQQSLDIRSLLEDEAGKAATLLNWGNLYQELYNYAKAEECFRQALLIYRRLGQADGQAKCYNQLGNNAFQQGDIPASAEWYAQARALAGALSEHDKAILYRNLANVKSELQQYNQAREDYMASLQAFRKLNNPLEAASVLLDIGNIFFAEGSFGDAANYYQKSLVELDTLSAPQLKAKVLYSLAQAYSQKRDTGQASYYLSQFNQARNGLGQEANEALNFQLSLEEERREQEVALHRNKLQQRQKVVNFSVAGLVILWLSLMVALLYANNNRKRRRIAEQNEKIALQEVKEVIGNKELDRAYAFIEGQDDERKRIARDLHDRLGSMLSMIKLNFTAVDERMAEIQTENRQQYDKANNLLDEACEEVRRISHNLESGIIAKFGLQAQLESMAEDYNDTRQFAVELSTHGLKKRLNNTLEVRIYRIIQELATNVVKHARASKLTLQVNRFDEMVNIMAEDNGIGFDPEQIKNKGGMGLQNVASRVHGLDGTLTIDSAPGRGTTIMIDIPIPPES
ncbi:MAG: sensor histidine kinase [Phaeodactylibacter sp.]|nr:sensor histidine kinase [Phaeodactylibacter sp.]MCB9276826.1 sensor histidine kinase [Lewinellaceae bacterium]